MASQSSSRGKSRAQVLTVSIITAVAVLTAAPATADSHSVECLTESLQDAIDAAAPGDTVVVTGVCDENIVIDKDLNISGGFFEGTIDGGARGSVVTIAAGADVAIDGLIIVNGRAVKGGGILNHGNLYIHGSRVEQNILFNGTGDPSQMAGAGIYNAPGAALEMREVWVTGNSGFSGAGGVENAGDAVLRDCWVNENWSLFDAGGVENRGSMEIDSCQVADNIGKASAIEHGPGGIGNWGDMTIAWSTIEGNLTWEGSGGGIKNAGTLVMTDTRVIANHAVRGGGVFVDSSGSFEAVDSDISSNSANTKGGGVYLSRETSAELVRTAVSENVARTGGGGAYVLWDASLVGSSVEFTLNTTENRPSVEGAGAGLFVLGGSLALEDSTVSYNTGAVTGGAISISSGAEASLVNTTVSSNEAFTTGGGIHNFQSTLSISGSSVVWNQAQDGGGLSASQGSSTLISDSLVGGNFASQWGGGVYNVAATLEVSGSAIMLNGAAGLGGGLFNKRGDFPAVADVANSTIGGNEAPGGSGVFNHDGHLTLEHVTVTENLTGVGIGVFRRVPRLVHSVVAGNPGGDCEPVVFGSGGHNVVGDCLLSAATGDVVGVADPDLAARTGPRRFTEWYEPRVGSPALDLIPAPLCSAVVDQRGVSRPQGAGCEAGSVEVEAPGGDLESPTVEPGFEFGHVFTESPVTLAGTATDDSGVARVRVAIRDRNSKLWLQPDMTSWGSFREFAATLSNPGGTATDWSFTVSLPDGNYSLSARAIDVADRFTEVKPWHHFNVAALDAILPEVTADYPMDTVFTTDPVVLTGTASDNLAIARVRVAIKHRPTGLWLQADGTSWGGYHGFDAMLSDPGAASTAWRFEVSLPDGLYSTSVQAIDESGNLERLRPWRRFQVRL